MFVKSFIVHDAGAEEIQDTAALDMGEGHLSHRILLLWCFHCIRKPLVGQSDSDSHVDSIPTDAGAIAVVGA